MLIVRFKVDDRTRYGVPMRAKRFDSFCPIGPCIATNIDPNAVAIEACINGELRQASSTKELVATVTPAGAGPLEPGDRVEIRIEGIGTLKNSVVSM